MCGRTIDFNIGNSAARFSEYSGYDSVCGDRFLRGRKVKKNRRRKTRMNNVLGLDDHKRSNDYPSSCLGVLVDSHVPD